MNPDRPSASAGRLVIGTRGSMLALAQAESVAAALRAHYPRLDVLIKTFTTRGDRTQEQDPVGGPLRDQPVAAIGGKGAFTAELESALLEGAIDLAVHSAKDLPAALTAGTQVLAWPKRDDPRDGLVIGPDNLAPGSLASIPVGAKVGTSSPRRSGQLKSLRPDLDILPIRGNIETRIRKVRQGQFAATVLAVAGLRRAGLLAEAAQVLSIDQMVPAAGQGALAVQGRAGDERVGRLAAALDDSPTRLAVEAERLVVNGLAGGCNMPLGVHVRLDSSGPGEAALTGRAVLVGAAGHPRVEAAARADNPQTVASLLVDQLLARGGSRLLQGGTGPIGGGQ